mgnify:CR=1 FL=1
MKLVDQLAAFRSAHAVTTPGALGTVLVVTRKAMDADWPIRPEALLTDGGGQVAADLGVEATFREAESDLL